MSRCVRNVDVAIWRRGSFRIAVSWSQVFVFAVCGLMWRLNADEMRKRMLLSSFARRWETDRLSGCRRGTDGRKNM